MTWNLIDENTPRKGVLILWDERFKVPATAYWDDDRFAKYPKPRWMPYGREGARHFLDHPPRFWMMWGPPE